MHAHSLDVKLSGGRRDWRRDPSRAGGGAAIAVALALLLAGVDQTQVGLVMTPPQLVFTAQPAGSTSAAQAVTLTNQGTTAVEVARLMLSNPASFGVTRTDCPDGQVPPGQSCTVFVDFHPPTAGTFVGALQQNAIGPRVDLSGAGSPAQLALGPPEPTPPPPDPQPPSAEPPAPAEPPTPTPQPAPTPPTTPPTPAPTPTPPPRGGQPPTPTPQPPAPVARASFAFASYDTKALVGDTAVVDVVLTNIGESTIGPVQLRFDGAPGFALQPGGCVLGAPGSTCTTSVSFTPPQEGTHTAALIAETNLELARTRLMGVATLKVPDAVLSTTRLEFIKTGQQATLVIQNRGSAPLRIGDVGVDNTRDFDIQADACRSRVVAPQQACAMFVRFRGRLRTSGRLTVRHNDPPLSSFVELVASPPLPLLRVPRVTGSKRDEALRDIERARFTLGKVAEVPQCDSLGEVVRQMPERNTEAIEGSPIDIWVASTGPNPTVVPGVLRQAQSVAERMILDARLQVRMGAREETDSVPSGAVARVDPRPGTALAANCPVTLRVAVPIPRIPVPSYVKRSLADVKQTLKGGGAGFFAPFRLGTVTTSDGSRVPPGEDQSWIVIAQSPDADTMVPRPSGLAVGTQIDLTVTRVNDGPVLRANPIK